MILEPDLFDINRFNHNGSICQTTSGWGEEVAVFIRIWGKVVVLYHVASWWWPWGVCAPIASLASRKKDRSTPRDMFLETLSGICEAGIHLRVRTHTLSLLYFLFFLITSSVLIIPNRRCTLFSFPIMQREHENSMSNSGLRKSVKKRIGRCFVEFLLCCLPPT